MRKYCSVLLLLGFLSNSACAGESFNQNIIKNINTQRYSNFFWYEPYPDPNNGNSINVIFSVGDILSAVGNNKTVSIDSLILSTNTGLDLDAKHPLVQRAVFPLLSSEEQAAIYEVFQSKIEEFNSNNTSDKKQAAADSATKYTISPMIEPITVKLIEDNENSLKAISFLATDLPEGGTNKDKKWKNVTLNGQNIRYGIFQALLHLDAVGAKSVALPLVGSSQIKQKFDKPPPNLNGYTSKEIGIRDCHLLLRQKSIYGIVDGIKDYYRNKRGDNRIKNIWIVLYEGDVKQFNTKFLEKARRDLLWGGFVGSIKNDKENELYYDFDKHPC